MQRVKRTTAVSVLPAAPAGGVPGYFVAPNPAGGIPATVPGYEWYNSVQEELCAVIAAAGTALDITNTSQLLAALRAAGVFQTAAQFDNSTKAATTAFVKKFGLEKSGETSISATTYLTGAHIGGTVSCSGTGGYTVYTPNASSVNVGSSVTIVNNATGPITIARSGTDTLYLGAAPITFFSLAPGDSIVLEAWTNTWIGSEGTALMAYSGQFGSSLTAAGYQKLPSGLILQWGQSTCSPTPNTPVNVAFPVAFASICFSVNVTNTFSATTLSVYSGSYTTAGFNVAATVASASVAWMAVGK